MAGRKKATNRRYRTAAARAALIAGVIVPAALLMLWLFRGTANRLVNVLVITMDTTRADSLGCYGQKINTTPNIDKLAARGIVFDQCVSAAPSTLPSHSTIFTGQYPFVHGARTNSSYVLHESNATLAEALQDAGYVTAAEVAAPVIGRKKLLDQGFQTYRDFESFDTVRTKIPAPPGSDEEQVVLPERTGEDISDHGIAFLREHAGDRFFLWLHYFDPHGPATPAEPFRSEIPQDAYLAEVKYVDHQIGRVLDELEVLGLTDSTLIVLTADHGESRGQHNEDSHSYFVYDTTIRVPLVIAPTRTPGKVASLVRTVDIAPTILDLLGQVPMETAMGESLRPLINGSSDDLDLLAYGESVEPKALFDLSVLRYVRQGGWKYIHKVNPELYFLTSDPDEVHNLASSRPEIVENLRDALTDLIADAPPAPADSTVAMDAEAMQQLEALGYIATGPVEGLEDELAALELAGADPASKTEDVRLWSAGLHYLRTHHFEAAVEALKLASERNPKCADILRTYAGALDRVDRPAEALAVLQQAMQVDPDHIDAYATLAKFAEAVGKPEMAIEHLLLALKMKPCSYAPRGRLAEVYRRMGRYEDQARVLTEGIKQCEDSIKLLNDYAYMRATSPVDALRDGQEAVRIMESITSKPENEHPGILDTLASAYAETGRFDEAVAASAKAITMLEERNEAEFTAQYRLRLEAFQKRQPWRED